MISDLFSDYIAVFIAAILGIIHVGSALVGNLILSPRQKTEAKSATYECGMLTIGARPMSNNSEVDFDGDAWFFTYQDRQMIADIERDAKVAMTYLGSAGLKGVLGAPGQFIHVEGTATVVRDKARFTEHWTKSLDRWFPQGVDTPGLVMIEVNAARVHYWDGEDEGEVTLQDRKA